MLRSSALFVIAMAAGAGAFAPRQAPLHRGLSAHRSGVVVGYTTTSDANVAVASLADSQAATVAAIRAAIPEVTEKPEQSWAPGAETVAGAPAVLKVGLAEPCPRATRYHQHRNDITSTTTTNNDTTTTTTTTAAIATSPLGLRRARAAECGVD